MDIEGDDLAYAETLIEVTQKARGKTFAALSCAGGYRDRPAVPTSSGCSRVTNRVYGDQQAHQMIIYGKGLLIFALVQIKKLMIFYVLKIKTSLPRMQSRFLF